MVFQLWGWPPGKDRDEKNYTLIHAPLNKKRNNKRSFSDLADSDWRLHCAVMENVETAEPSLAGLGTTVWGEKRQTNQHFIFRVYTKTRGIHGWLLLTFNIIGCLSVTTLGRHWWASSVKDDCTGKLYTYRGKIVHLNLLVLKSILVTTWFLLDVT